MKLYISGQMTGIKDKNLTAFETAALVVDSLGHNAVTPFDLNVVEPCDAYDWIANMKRDIKYLPTFDGVVVLEGWEQSRGARIEVAIATWLNIPIYYIGWQLTNGPELKLLLVSADLEITPLVTSEFWK